MIQELVIAVADTEDAVAQVAARFAAGDPADALLRRLAGRVAEVSRLAVEDGSAEARAAVARLVARVDGAVAAGAEWLDRAARPDPASAVQQRVLKAYRLPPD